MSNKVLKEFNQTDTGFDFGDLSRIASKHGTPEQLIKDVYQNGYEDGSKDFYEKGYADGLIDGKNADVSKLVVSVAATLIVTGVISGVGYFKTRKKSKKEIEKLAKEISELKSEQYANHMLNIDSEEDNIELDEGKKIIYGVFDSNKHKETRLRK